jgi:hypothetical protein
VGVFAVTMVSGPHWDVARARRAQPGWDEHAAFCDGLVDEGFVILGGPIGDGDRVMLVVEPADESETAARLARDPWVSGGVLRIGEIQPWTIWLDGRQASRPS